MLRLANVAGEPREFGAYRLVRRLGVGGMAETFEAVRRESDGFEQRVCLKRVLPAYSSDPSFVERFRLEAKVAASLRHSNIVGVTDFGEVDGVSFMALELVDGVDLRSFLRSLPEHRLDPDMVTSIGLDLAYALEHAHERVVHRDVSPSNVLLGRSGEAKLADFGIAKAIGTESVTISRGAQGKVPYMSPEQIRGDRVDARSDLFSLGVVLFEALAGARPFDGAHDVVTMQRIVEGRRLDLAELAPSAPPRLRRTIDALAEIDPANRPQNAGAVVEALSQVTTVDDPQRRLAVMVERQRGGPATRMHVRARQAEPDTELSPAEQLPTPDGHARPVASTRKSRALLSTALLASLGFGAWLYPWKPEPADETSEAREPVTQAAPTVSLDADIPDVDAETLSGNHRAEARTEEKIDETANGSGHDRGSSRNDASEAKTKTGAPDAASGEDARAARGWVHVVVQPWGNVWVDGVWMGRAPVSARVDEGRHVVEVGRDLPAKKRAVYVERGARKSVELSLGE